MNTFSGRPGTEKVLAEYIWLGGDKTNALRSESRVLDFRPASVAEVPVVSVEVEMGAAEIILQPKKIFSDPIRGGDNILVLCDALQQQQMHESNLMDPSSRPCLVPVSTSHRAACSAVMDEAFESEPMFAAHQDYTLHSASTQDYDYRSQSGDSCDDGDLLPDDMLPSCVANTLFMKSARDTAEAHLSACLKAGLKVSSSSMGPDPTSWKYSLGPLPGVEFGDQLWVSRFIADRVSEKMGMLMSFDPSHHAGHGDGSQGRCSIEYSTRQTRNKATGLQCIQSHLGLLAKTHLVHLATCAQPSRQALRSSGNNVYPSGVMWEGNLEATFSVSVGTCRGSVMIPTMTMLNGCGHYMDLRPSSDIDPYDVSALLVLSTVMAAGGETSGASVAAATPVISPCQPVHSVQASAVSMVGHGCSTKRKLPFPSVDELEESEGSHIRHCRRASAGAENNHTSEAPFASNPLPVSVVAPQECHLSPEPDFFCASGLGYSLDSSDEPSLCTEDVLIDELEKLDGEFESDDESSCTSPVCDDSAPEVSSGAKRLSSPFLVGSFEANNCLLQSAM